MTRPERKRRLEAAMSLARERATHWWVWATTTTGDLKQPRLVKASGEQEARRRVRRAVAARPSLPSRTWRAIYEEVGLL